MQKRWRSWGWALSVLGAAETKSKEEEEEEEERDDHTRGKEHSWLGKTHPAKQSLETVQLLHRMISQGFFLGGGPYLLTIDMPSKFHVPQ